MNPTELIEWHRVCEDDPPSAGEIQLFNIHSGGKSSCIVLPGSMWPNSVHCLYTHWTKIKGPSSVKEEKLVFEASPVFHVDPDVMQMAQALCRGGIGNKLTVLGDELFASGIVKCARLIVEKVRAGK